MPVRPSVDNVAVRDFDGPDRVSVDGNDSVLTVSVGDGECFDKACDIECVGVRGLTVGLVDIVRRRDSSETDEVRDSVSRVRDRVGLCELCVTVIGNDSERDLVTPGCVDVPVCDERRLAVTSLMLAVDVPLAVRRVTL